MLPFSLGGQPYFLISMKVPGILICGQNFTTAFTCLTAIKKGEAKLIKKAAKAIKKNIYATDDAALVERIGGKICVVMGSHENIKITVPEDLIFAEAILRKRIAYSV